MWPKEILRFVAMKWTRWNHWEKSRNCFKQLFCHDSHCLSYFDYNFTWSVWYSKTNPTWDNFPMPFLRLSKICFSNMGKEQCCQNTYMNIKMILIVISWNDWYRFSKQLYLLGVQRLVGLSNTYGNHGHSHHRRATGPDPELLRKKKKNYTLFNLAKNM